MFTFFSNLFTIVTKVPAIIGIIKAILDIVGSEAVQEILRLIKETVQSTRLDQPLASATPAERVRFIKRVRERVGQRMLGLSDQQCAAMKNIFKEETFA